MHQGPWSHREEFPHCEPDASSWCLGKGGKGWPLGRLVAINVLHDCMAYSVVWVSKYTKLYIEISTQNARSNACTHKHTNSHTLTHARMHARTHLRWTRSPPDSQGHRNPFSASSCCRLPPWRGQSPVASDLVPCLEPEMAGEEGGRRGKEMDTEYVYTKTYALLHICVYILTSYRQTYV